MRKFKCGICGYRFNIARQQVYTVSVPTDMPWTVGQPLRERAENLMNVTDCPKCGCQIQLAVRYPDWRKTMETEWREFFKRFEIEPELDTSAWKRCGSIINMK